MVFSDVTNGYGITQQTRDLMRVDATQWSNAKIANSVNNWLDMVAGYAIATDKRFQWDDTNHTKMPIGTTSLNSSQTDYSFLTDEQDNRIITLTRIELQDSDGAWTKLEELDENLEDEALAKVVVAGQPTGYYKLADNIIRLNRIPEATISGGLKFFFQRNPSYFVSTDTTKEPGVSNLLHRGFVIASAYDGALALGLPNLQPLSVEMQKEEAKMIEYFGGRNNDVKGRLVAGAENNR